MDELTDWYIKNKNSWVSFMMNTGFSKEDAEDIMSDVYLYCLQDLEIFSVANVSQIILFRIKNTVRDKKVYEKYLKEYASMLYTLQEGGDRESREDMMGLIKEEIATYAQESTRCVLIGHLIEGEILEGLCGYSRDAAGKIVARFKKKMVKKYGMHI